MELKKFIMFLLSGLLILTSLLSYNQSRIQKELESREVAYFAWEIKDYLSLLEDVIESRDIVLLSELKESTVEFNDMLVLRIRPYNNYVDYFWTLSDFYQSIIDKGIIDKTDYEKLTNIYTRFTNFNQDLYEKESEINVMIHTFKELDKLVSYYFDKGLIEDGLMEE